MYNIFQSAVDWDYKEKIEKHGSQRDYSSGFGGKYGVQMDRQDKSAVGWDHMEKVEKHESQKGNVSSNPAILITIFESHYESRSKKRITFIDEQQRGFLEDYQLW